MAEDVVIRAEGLGKKYVIGHQAQREGYVALRDVIARNVRTLGRTAMDVVRGRPTVAGDELEEFWALRDVDFEIRRGEVVGVIGRNGAGKSTLLKVLSRITEPTKGRVQIRGRVASLLEVGTGFHPELTGRENIYLNGAILGMTHAEIRRKFDEIVDFAEVERFLDTPVKRYSSGMYVRLAFAVAAHLEPEILIVDEVLAVGDAEFQKKCLGKMGEVAGQGRTVLFVSHQLDVVTRLCGRTILLDSGKPIAEGDTGDVVRHYQSLRVETSDRSAAVISDVKITVSLRDVEIHARRTSQITVDISSDSPISFNETCLIITDLNEHRVALMDFRVIGRQIEFRGPETKSYKIEADNMGLVSGEYNISLWLLSNVGSSELSLGYITVYPDEELNRLSIYPESMNGIVGVYGKIEQIYR